MSDIWEEDFEEKMEAHYQKKSMTDKSQSRERFSVVAAVKWPHLRMDLTGDDDNEMYDDPYTEAYFDGWQAALTDQPAVHPLVERDELSSETCDLVDRFAEALKQKLAAAEAKYGYGIGWKDDNWRGDLVKKLADHIDKGDPRDVAAYCAFAWHHGWSVASDQPAAAGAAGEEDGLPQGYANWYNSKFNGQTVDTQRDHHCEEAWRAALRTAAPSQQDAGGVVSQQLLTALKTLLPLARNFEKQASKGVGGRRGGEVFARAQFAIDQAEAALRTAAPSPAVGGGTSDSELSDFFEWWCRVNGEPCGPFEADKTVAEYRSRKVLQDAGKHERGEQS